MTQQTTHHTGLLVQRARKAAGLTSERLAELCTTAGVHMSRAMVTNIETGRREISNQELIVIARVLGIPPAMLLYPLYEPYTIPPGETRTAIELISWFNGSTIYDPLAPHTETVLNAQDETFEVYELLQHLARKPQELKRYITEITASAYKLQSEEHTNDKEIPRATYANNLRLAVLLTEHIKSTRNELRLRNVHIDKIPFHDLEKDLNSLDTAEYRLGTSGESFHALDCEGYTIANLKTRMTELFAHR